MADYLIRAHTLKEKLVALRRDLHKHPELSFQEIRTAQQVAQTLQGFGIEYTTGIAKTGVVAQIGVGSPTIALRADMDALPLTEANDIPYASQNPGVMHACGHDVHVAALLGAAELLAEDLRAGQLRGCVRFLFQPSEEAQDAEGKSGAMRMVEEGALDGVDAVIGLHVSSTLPANQVFIREGPFMAAVDNFVGTVMGRGGHGAYPHEALDPIWLAVQVANAIYSLISRRIDPVEHGLITIGMIHAGTANNIIPVEARLEGTIRSFKQSVREQLRQDLEKTFALTRTWGGDYRLQFEYGYPVTMNDPALARFVREMTIGLLGADRVQEAPLEMGAEDFSYLAQAKPGAFFYLGAKKDDVDRQHHAPDFDIDETVLPTGAALLAEAARKFLEER